ncbi:MAG: hypothetical protein CMQ24_08825 [Gammaproteobacteria bacterium]|nr:hypothetical protein [Gammaproteobacteria bacterium]
MKLNETALAELAEAHGTAQIVVTESGHRIYERLFTDEAVDVFAVQKGLVALLFGIAGEQGLVDLDDPINHHLTPGWTELGPSDEASLSVRTLLTMTTGMSDTLGPQGTVNRTWRYNNVAYNYLKKILCLHTGLTLDEVTREWLTGPLGMTSTRWVDRDQILPDGRPLTGLLSTAADLAALAALVLDRGRDLVPAWFIAEMTRPGSDENPAWGLCWWANNRGHFMVPMRDGTRDGPIIPAAPRDLIAARGAGENGLYVVPSLGLTVTRTARPGRATVRGSFERPLWELLCG